MKLTDYDISAERGFLADFEPAKVVLPVSMHAIRDAALSLPHWLPTGRIRALLERLPEPDIEAFLADATRGYAELGREVGLSAPAVHERVKKLKAAGVIRRVSAEIDGAAVGRPLLVFIHVATNNWGHSEAIDRLSELPELEEMHSVTGDTSMILKVRLADTEALEALLRQINAFESVVATHTFVTLSTYLERPVQAEVTSEWAAPPLPRE